MRRWLPLVAIALLACSAESEPAAAPAPRGAAEASSGAGAAARAPAPEAGAPALAERGRRVYMSNCIACHSPDPAEAGAIGPPLAGSPEALLRAKVLRNEYPPGYQPQRTSQAMIPLPHLESEIPALAAWLAEREAGS
jgi:mono/diheme cytochrome c family protein